jgi:predicted ATPase
LWRASGQPEEEVEVPLDELTRRRILREHDDGGYDFSHDKIRSVAYAMLSAARRRVLHARIAETLETLHPDLDAVSALARHHEQAGHLQRAIELYQRAGDLARRVYANTDAVTHLQRAALLLGSLPPTPGSELWRARTACAVQESLGEVLVLMSNHAAALAAYQTGRTLALQEDLISGARLWRKAAAASEGQHEFPVTLSFLDRAEETLGPQPADPNAEWWQEWITIQLGRLMVYCWTADIDAMNPLSVALGPVVE